MAQYKSSKAAGLLIIAAIYLIAIGVGIVAFNRAEGLNPLVRLFEADFWATVVVWFFGVLLRNSSVYDPYWSVAPPLLLTGYAAYCATIHLPILLMLIAVWFWGIRLTANWAYTFHNLQEEDWRYVMYRERCPKTWHLVNFMGINMMPTIVVFIAVIPAILLIELDPIRANIAFIVGYIISVAAAALQWEADRQAHRFRRENPGKVCSTGLWKYSRHPNYLGEILMWWGVGIMYVAFVPSHWFVLLGALIVTCLFIFISIPMMEKRQLARKPEYASYKEKTRML